MCARTILGRGAGNLPLIFTTNLNLTLGSTAIYDKRYEVDRERKTDCVEHYNRHGVGTGSKTRWRND